MQQDVVQRFSPLESCLNENLEILDDFGLSAEVLQPIGAQGFFHYQFFFVELVFIRSQVFIHAEERI